jgi:glycosyltransferase involved in cell wall biosynthesis
MAESTRGPTVASRLRVLMTTDCLGGVFSYALALARELARRGATVHLATMGERMRSEQRDAAHAVPSLTLHESSFALEWMESPWAEVDRAGQWLVALERELRPSVVHLNGFAHGDAGFRAPVVIVGHSCVVSWWEAVLGEDAPPAWNVYRTRVREGIEGARAVLAPSEVMLAALQRHHGPLPSPRVVHNGLPPLPRGGAGLPPSRRDPVVLAAGRIWDQAKNLTVLERVAPRVAWPIRVAGSDLHPGGTRRPLRNVDARGWLSPAALGHEMERASVFVAPARYEPFGLGPLEAAQRGCALVLGDIASLREVWGDAAVFVPPDDVDAIAGALSDLAEDALLRARMAGRAAERARRYTAAAMVDGTLAAYEAAGVVLAPVAGHRRDRDGGDASAS